MAQHICIEPEKLSRILSGRSSTGATLSKIADYLGVTIDYALDVNQPFEVGDPIPGQVVHGTPSEVVTPEELCMLTLAAIRSVGLTEDLMQVEEELKKEKEKNKLPLKQIEYERDRNKNSTP